MIGRSMDCCFRTTHDAVVFHHQSLRDMTSWEAIKFQAIWRAILRTSIVLFSISIMDFVLVCDNFLYCFCLWAESYEIINHYHHILFQMKETKSISARFNSSSCSPRKTKISFAIPEYRSNQHYAVFSLQLEIQMPEFFYEKYIEVSPPKL